MNWYVVEDAVRSTPHGEPYRLVRLVHFPMGWSAMATSYRPDDRPRWSVTAPHTAGEMRPADEAGWAALDLDPDSGKYRIRREDAGAREPDAGDERRAMTRTEVTRLAGNLAVPPPSPGSACVRCQGTGQTGWHSGTSDCARCDGTGWDPSGRP